MDEMATSGSFTGGRGGSSTGPYLKLSWSRIATDISGNRSQLRLTLQLISDYNIGFSASKSGNLEGHAFTYSGGMSGTGTKTLRTLDLWYNHDTNGNLSTTLSASFNIAVNWGGSYVSSISVSGTASVDSIPRASGFTAFSLSNSTLNTSTATTINYTLDRKSTSFSQDMTLKYGSTVIASWNTTGTGALTRTFSATEVNKVISAMPNSTSGTLTLVMQTKSGSSNIGSSISKTVSVSLNSAIKPSASSLSVSIYGSGRDKTINKYVQGISKVTASFSRSAGYGASISTNTITVKRQSDGGNSQTISSYSGTTANAVSLSGTYVIEGYVKDSRGRTDTVSTTITVDAYAPPSITKFTASRTSTSTTVSNAITANWSIGASNPTSITVTSKNNAGTTTTVYSVTGQTAGTLSTTQSYTGQSDTSSYVYTITVTDSFGNKATATSLVGTTFVEMSIARGKGVGIGKVWEKGALDVGGTAYIQGDVIATAQGSFDNVWTRLIQTTAPKSRFQADGQYSRTEPKTGAIMIEGYNNLLAMGTGDTNNDRNAWIQSRHNSSSYATVYGRLRLNPLGGVVEVGESMEVGFGDPNNANAGMNGSGSVAISMKGKAIIQGEGIEMNWTTPYIDFKTTYSEDYDGRIILRSNGEMQILGTYLRPLAGISLGSGAQASGGGAGTLWYGNGFSGEGLYLYKSGWHLVK
jgi:hypothetical protein